ncbi:MAG: hypothetical protein RLZZ419_1815 [Pseudomonadota bacterium]|jgi:hypothetical protein
MSSIYSGINPYGDEYKVISESYGSDISSQRRDELDVACAQYALSLVAEAMKNGQSPPQGIDIGSGLGVPSIAMSLLGCRMLLIDILDLHGRFEILRQQLPLFNLIYLQKDAQVLTPNDFPQYFDFAYSQRFLHYLRFDDATTLLQKVSSRMNTDARLFISASGLTSELGENYPHAKNPVHQRFSRLSKPYAIKHGILEEVCLYTLNDLIHLAESVGFSPVHVYQSRFCNVKGIFSKT